MNVLTGTAVSELFDTKRLLLSSPEQRQIDSLVERLDGKL
jgi:hypothetical protein